MRYIIVMLFLLCFFSLKAQKTDTTFVWAKNGLKVRAEPNAKANVLATLPYGTALKTVRTNFFFHDSIKVIPPFEMSNNTRFQGYYVYDFWQKVALEATEGYVFSGYISNLKPFEEKSEKQGYQATLVRLSEWMRQNARVMDSISLLEHGNYGRPSVSKIYSNHIVEQVAGEIEEGGIGTYTVGYIFPPNFNFHDGFILANYFHGFKLPDVPNSQAEYNLSANCRKDFIYFRIGTKVTSSGLKVSYENGVLILIFEEGSC